ncbi:RhoGAP domain containing protein [Histomonas meleagridis]|uniref:RhoGAP domain containing protein n=1 Tax=Histomonas meleagridis TaxID=135588 RepID=UPI00355A80A2|nr:RhoGAP domain containing protein [Histomonas meleagridis]KAH0806252.1 RhoGAP domain containing protein [Histomonas meleagridis]
MSPKVYYEYVSKNGKKYYVETDSKNTTFEFPADSIIFDPKTKSIIYQPPGNQALLESAFGNNAYSARKRDSLSVVSPNSLNDNPIIDDMQYIPPPLSSSSFYESNDDDLRTNPSVKDSQSESSLVYESESFDGVYSSTSEEPSLVNYSSSNLSKNSLNSKSSVKFNLQSNDGVFKRSISQLPNPLSSDSDNSIINNTKSMPQKIFPLLQHGSLQHPHTNDDSDGSAVSLFTDSRQRQPIMRMNNIKTNDFLANPTPRPNMLMSNRPKKKVHRQTFMAPSNVLIQIEQENLKANSRNHNSTYRRSFLKSQTHQIISPLTNQEILYDEFNSDKNNVISSMAQYKIVEFAKKQFRQHKRSSAISRKFIPIEDLVSFSFKPLHKPLLKVIPNNLKKQGAALFEMILQYTGVKECANPISLVNHAISTLTKYPVLIDELFFQLVKQTTNSFNSERLMKTWELFLIFSCIFPVSPFFHMQILAHIGRNTFHEDPKIAEISLCTYIYFESRFYVGERMKKVGKSTVKKILSNINGGTELFNVTLYVLLWSQRKSYPKLPIPYIEYSIIQTLLHKNAKSAKDIFIKPGNQAVVEAMIKQEQATYDLIKNSNVYDIASLLIQWIKLLPNSLIPIFLLDDFKIMCESEKYFEFLDKLPQAHYLSLMYFVGFLQELTAHSDENGTSPQFFSTLFGPYLVQSAARFKSPTVVETLNALAIQFMFQLIQSWETNLIYPLNPLYLV